jgi:hypothetical protein
VTGCVTELVQLIDTVAEGDGDGVWERVGSAEKDLESDGELRVSECETDGVGVGVGGGVYVGLSVPLIIDLDSESVWKKVTVGERTNEADGDGRRVFVNVAVRAKVILEVTLAL